MHPNIQTTKSQNSRRPGRKGGSTTFVKIAEKHIEEIVALRKFGMSWKSIAGSFSTDPILGSVTPRSFRDACNSILKTKSADGEKVEAMLSEMMSRFTSPISILLSSVSMTDHMDPTPAPILASPESQKATVPASPVDVVEKPAPTFDVLCETKAETIQMPEAKAVIVSSTLSAREQALINLEKDFELGHRNEKLFSAAGLPTSIFLRLERNPARGSGSFSRLIENLIKTSSSFGGEEKEMLGNALTDLVSAKKKSGGSRAFGDE